MFKQHFKSAIYLAILIVPFLLFFLKPPIFKTIALVDLTIGPLAFLKAPLDEIKKIVTYHQTYEEHHRLKKEGDVLKA